MRHYRLMFKFPHVILSGFLGCAIYAQPLDSLREHLSQVEGYRHVSYKDSLGNPTIGIGHKIKNGEVYHNITSSQIESLFIQDITLAKKAAIRLVPSFYSHPEQVQIIIVSLVFNLGPNGFSKFRRFRSALENKNYKLTALELSDSLWANQVPNRAKLYISTLNKM